ncbi:hypothetical protein RFY98_01290, partial [Acinetobacter baumannii]|nr:hypothetical protein [Acinetobacter baumannii]
MDGLDFVDYYGHGVAQHFHYKYQKTYASKTPHEIEQIKFLGGRIPDPPEYSYAADSILSAFSTICRSRRYEQSIPLSLDQQAINVYAEHNDLPV